MIQNSGWQNDKKNNPTLCAILSILKEALTVDSIDDDEQKMDESNDNDICKGFSLEIIDETNENTNNISDDMTNLSEQIDKMLNV